MEKELSGKEAFEAFMKSISPEDMAKIANDMKNVYAELLDKHAKEKAGIVADIEKLTAEEKSIYEKERQTEWPERSKLTEQRMSIKGLIEARNFQLMHQDNVIESLENYGEITTLTDMEGKEYPDLPDYRRIKTEQIAFDEETILGEQKPIYIPKINEKTFARRGYIFDAIRIEKDTYILSTDYFAKDKVINYVLVTLDQLVLTLDYYYTKAKAEAKKEAEERTERNEKHYDSLPEERRRAILFQNNYYSALPAKIKKTITKDEYEKLDLAGREKLYKPFKRYGAKRLKSKLESTEMWVSFHTMYQKFINPKAGPVDRNGVPQLNPKNTYGLYANPEVSKYWKAFREFMQFKIKDLKAQRDEQSETYKKAYETSFGPVNTEDLLLDKYGILIKRQSGVKVTPKEADDIERAWSRVQNTFGNLKPNALKYSLKISHSGKKQMFAARAIGMFVPHYHTIGVSDKYGYEQFESTMAHEVGHFIDYFVGQLTGKRYATDDYESTAGIIAFTFRNYLNKPKSQQTDYVNATKECFARAFQQYFAYKNYGKEAVLTHSYKELDRTMPIYKADDFLSYENFEEHILPLIEKFKQEQMDVLETTVDIDGTDKIEPVSNLKDTDKDIKEVEQIAEVKVKVKVKEDDIESIIKGLKILLEDANSEQKQELESVIKGLELLRD